MVSTIWVLKCKMFWLRIFVKHLFGARRALTLLKYVNSCSSSLQTTDTTEYDSVFNTLYTYID